MTIRVGSASASAQSQCAVRNAVQVPVGKCAVKAGASGEVRSKRYQRGSAQQRNAIELALNATRLAFRVIIGI